MAAPEYMNGLWKSWELGVGVYSLLQLVYLVDGTKLWRLTKQLNDESNGRATTTLEADGQLLPGKQAANNFADTYAEVSTIPVTKSPIANVRHEGSKGKGRHTKLHTSAWTRSSH